MGNTTEFLRVIGILEEEMTFEKDINVSVFETNIRGIMPICHSKAISMRFYNSKQPSFPFLLPKSLASVTNFKNLHRNATSLQIFYA